MSITASKLNANLYNGDMAYLADKGDVKKLDAALAELDKEVSE